MKRFLTVIGTRPNIIKITQFRKVTSRYPGIDLKLVHTGQHFNTNMSDQFFTELGLDQPDFMIQSQSASVTSQFASIMIGLEKVIHEYKPDYLIVVGDVNSTLAAALTANKMNIKLIHVESGLRSFDRSMPEEHNRVLTDQLTDIFFVTEESGKQNLLKEGKPEEKIFFVGNTMIDTLVAYEEMIRKSNILESLNLQPGKYILMTMHRPANVDSKEGLLKMIDIIEEICKEFKLVFPIHPRTVNRLMEFDLFAQLKRNKNLCLTEPAGYLNFQKLILESFLVITDSGGIQEETTFRKIPCLTLRANTERPSTIEIGSNKLLPYEKKDIMLELDKVRKGTFKKGNIPPLWDGKATERIFQILDIGF